MITPSNGTGKLRIVVLGYIVRGPLGGIAWHHLQYVLGLRQLGHEVYFFEESEDYASCYDPEQNTTTADPSVGLAFAGNVFGKYNFASWAYFDAHTSNWHGPSSGEVQEVIRSADVLLNISGVNPVREWFQDIPVRVLIDTDPAFTQIRNLTEPDRRARSLQHNAFFTFGENIESHSTSVPDDGFPWQATRQPVVLDLWTPVPGSANAKFTTVMQWESYPAREYRGIRYGMKSDSFEPYFDLPERAGKIFTLALGGMSGSPARFRKKGWQVVDPRIPTRDPWIYQRFIRNSKAEFGIAKHGYVASRCGWFSERSTSYMASGRPVLVQDTGFTDWLPTGEGVLKFSTPEEAIQGIEEINSRFEFHCRAARRIVTEYFDSRKVLSRLMERIFSAARAS